MPLQQYRNDGTGRDTYINSGANKGRAASRSPTDSFGPPSPVKSGQNSLQSTLGSESACSTIGLTKQTFSLPEVMAKRGGSAPNNGIGLGASLIGQTRPSLTSPVSAHTPLSAASVSSMPSPLQLRYESTCHYSLRTGRYGTPYLAPALLLKDTMRIKYN